MSYRIPVTPFAGVKFMRADGCSLGGFSACLEGDEGAFAVVPVEAVRKILRAIDAVEPYTLPIWLTSEPAAVDCIKDTD